MHSILSRTLSAVSGSVLRVYSILFVRSFIFTISFNRFTRHSEALFEISMNSFGSLISVGSIHTSMRLKTIRSMVTTTISANLKTSFRFKNVLILLKILFEFCYR